MAKMRRAVIALLLAVVAAAATVFVSGLLPARSAAGRGGTVSVTSGGILTAGFRIKWVGVSVIVGVGLAVCLVLAACVVLLMSGIKGKRDEE